MDLLNSIDSIQFDFMPGKETTNTILFMRQVQERQQAKKKLYYASVEVGKASDCPEESGTMDFEEVGCG